MKILVNFEESGTVTEKLRDNGYDAWSCDILPTRGKYPEYHIKQDGREVAYDGRWDVMIAHPVCKYLANSGSKHLYIDGNEENGRCPIRWQKLENGAADYRILRDAPIPHKAIENPVMHGHAIELTKRGPTKFVHPYFFGDPFLKFTGFEMINFPWLKPFNRLVPPKPKTEMHKKWSQCHRMGPSENRERDRSVTYPGIAEALLKSVDKIAGFNNELSSRDLFAI